VKGEDLGGNWAMWTAPTIEERLAAIEQELLALKQGKPPIEPKIGWLEKITGTFKEDPEFGEILRLGQEIRKTEKMEGANGEG
jgi:hypothetical protein